jgi:hypothetical protein
MSFKDLFLIFSKKDYEKVLMKKIASLEMNIEELKKTLSANEEINQHGTESKMQEPPIIIEKITIEKIILDKFELNNNFGQLGIKELKGKLNIGATYGSDFPLMKEEDGKEEESRKQKFKKPTQENGPKVNIQAMRE